ncbi:MAG TPA: hypothetical protein VMV51_06075 [Gemmatimonadaceae bacterium]|nr:hypothetical protein [Gemmatimonadaceae bacterium]
MPKKPKKSATPRPPAKPESGRLTYRELRNTPGRVWERLSNDEPLTLVADGEAKAVLIPVPDGDVATALEAYRRGRALIALRRIREQARQNGTAAMTLEQINEVVREVRSEHRRRERGA